ncbi:MAG TPA: peptidoglycan-binding domain-containing protein [Clostridia bacterium]|nr:peptidoglycan-binding domain-containing protein [Clostridia bacterium]
MSTKVKISEMLAYYEPHAIVTDGKTTNPPPKDQWGYYMGGDGRIATDAYAKARAKSSYPLNWEAYYEIYKRWIGHPVIDCNAVAEAFYKLVTGVNIDTKAKSNYANWCFPKSPATPDKLLAGLPQMPGVALFSGSSAADITHVGFLLRKVGDGPLDWLVLEARGKEYGLVITTLKSREWRWWGVMSKYFDYEETKEEPKVATVITKNLTVDEDVRKLQAVLNALGYPCGVEDGKAGDNTMKALKAFCAAHVEPVTVETPAVLPDKLILSVDYGGKRYGLDIKAL